MKYTAVMGNPPYTINHKGANNSGATAIYPSFVIAIDYFSKLSSIIAPARWFTSPKAEMRSARVELQDSGFAFLDLVCETGAVFLTAELTGGTSWYLREAGYKGDTRFWVNGVKTRHGSLFDSVGTITFDELDDLRQAIREAHHFEFLDSSHSFDWSLPDFAGAEEDGYSNEAYFKHSAAKRRTPADIRMRMTDGSWRYFTPDALPERCYVPQGRFGFSFSELVHFHSKGINDRSLLLLSSESAKGTSTFFFDSQVQCANFYKYARTKFFATIVVGRISSHHARPQVYQDIPKFRFTNVDPIDWTKSIPEIDKQLIAHFGLEDYREYILSASKPYARTLGQEYLDRLTEANVDTSGINEWY